MKTRFSLRYFLYLSILIVGCTTGKNALQKGNYDASVSKAVDRLRNAPKNNEAKQVLATAYGLALQTHLRNIEEAKLSSDLLRWEYVLSNYQQLNQLSNEINSCQACMEIVPDAKRFNAEIEDSKYKAAEVRYASGIKALEENNRMSARKAYYDFERAFQLYPGFKDVLSKIDEAYQAAVLRVLVEPSGINSPYYNYSTAYFQEKVDGYLRNYQGNKFVQFYTVQQAANLKIKADQVLSLNFDDFVIGQTYIKEKVEKIKRDSVIVGQTRSNQPIYGTVKASFSTFDKQVASSGLLSLKITDWATGKVIKQRRLPGTYVWQDSWASFKGDERALDDYQLKMSRKKELLPPAGDALFVAFTKPIYAQLVNEVNAYYDRY